MTSLPPPTTSTSSSSSSSSCTSPLLPLLLLLLLTLPACTTDPDEEACAEKKLTASATAFNLGDLHPIPEDSLDDPSGSATARFERVLLLHAGCGGPVTITDACLVAPDDAPEGGDEAFTLEGPTPEVLEAGEIAALRVTYTRAEPLEPEAGDEEGEKSDEAEEGEEAPAPTPPSDFATLVVLSDAQDNPTIAVPVCARLRSTDDSLGEIPCEAKVEVEPGKAERGLCTKLSYKIR